MTIKGTEVGKRFNQGWIFRDLSFEFKVGDQIAITGPNGSGKSTLLQIILGATTPSKGKVEIIDPPHRDDWQNLQEIAFCSPYMELIEEFSLEEQLNFHGKFKNATLSPEEIADKMGYPDALDKRINQFSSGMKQRLKLALCFYFDAKIMALDEPTSNLDEQGVEWYLNEVKRNVENRITLIASNQRIEYEFCTSEISLV